MGTLVHAKNLNGKKVWYVYGAEGDSKWEKLYPQCRSRSDFYGTLRDELGLPTSAGRTDIVFALMNKTWTMNGWEDDFSIRLKRLRKQTRLTQGSLADRAGLSVQAISALENGTRAPSWETVRRLAFALGVEEKEFKVCLSKDEVSRSMEDFF